MSGFIILGVFIVIGSLIIWFLLPESTVGKKIGVVATYIATTAAGFWASLGMGN